MDRPGVGKPGLRPAVTMETAGPPKFPRNPRDHSPCSLTPAGPSTPVGPCASLPTWPPLVTTTRAPHDGRFRGSIARRLISLSTLRGEGYPHHARLASGCWQLYRTGLVTRRVPEKVSTFVAILLFRLLWHMSPSPCLCPLRRVSPSPCRPLRRVPSTPCPLRRLSPSTPPLRRPLGYWRRSAAHVGKGWVCSDPTCR